MEFVITPNTDVPPADDLTCEECGTPLTYAGRGRKPRYCAEHRKQPAANPRKVPSGRIGSTDALVNQISNLYMVLGTVLGMSKATTFDGMIVASNAAELAESWRPILDSNPKVRAFWEKASTTGNLSVLIGAHIGVILPIMAHHGIGPKFMQPTQTVGSENV
jgi:hypothetical protein